MKSDSETFPLYIKETKPIFTGTGMETGIRFILERKHFTKKKNEGELSFPVKEVRCLELTSGEIDIPEAVVLQWLKDWTEKKGGKK